jgi:hypothetical protein
VDSLSVAQLTSLLAPTGVATWESAGGIGGRPRGLALAADAAAIAAIEALGGAGSAVTVPTYDDLFALLAKPGAGYLAFVSLAELRPAGVALAIDGLDLARGTGEAAEWPFVDRISVVPHTAAGRDALPAVMARLAAPLPRVTRVVATGDILNRAAPSRRSGRRVTGRRRCADRSASTLPLPTSPWGRSMAASRT